MKNLVAQIVVQVGSINMFLGLLVTLFAWIVKEIFGMKRTLSLILYRLNSCQCQASFIKKEKEEE